MHDTEDKKHWVQAFGPSAEWETVKRLWAAGLRATLNPDKRNDPYVIDALMELPVDIKVQRTPFRTADRYGIDPSWCVVLNPRPLERYPDIGLILFDVEWEAETLIEARKGLYLTSVRELRARKHPIHRYQRRVNDAVNNREAYLLDLRDMTCVR